MADLSNLHDHAVTPYIPDGLLHIFNAAYMRRGNGYDEIHDKKNEIQDEIHDEIHNKIDEIHVNTSEPIPPHISKPVYPQLCSELKNARKCAVCDLKENIWLCLLCGHAGCGR
jgi:uncharacterized UBP type Zn finger protein